MLLMMLIWVAVICVGNIIKGIAYMHRKEYVASELADLQWLICFICLMYALYVQQGG